MSIQARLDALGITLPPLAVPAAAYVPFVRSGNLVFALFAFVVYYNLLNLGQSWIGSGRASFPGFLLALHGGVMVMGLLWLGKQHNNWTWRALARRRPARAAAAGEPAPWKPCAG